MSEVDLVCLLYQSDNGPSIFKLRIDVWNLFNENFDFRILIIIITIYIYLLFHSFDLFFS